MGHSYEWLSFFGEKGQNVKITLNTYLSILITQIITSRFRISGSIAAENPKSILPFFFPYLTSTGSKNLCSYC